MNKNFIKIIQKKLVKAGYGQIVVKYENGATVLEGELLSYEDILKCGQLAISKKSRGVVNNIKLKGYTPKPMRIPSFKDNKYEGKTPDVLIIGGGIVGCAIARELSKYELDVMLVEKESDVAMAQSSRNDGEIHPGIDLKSSSIKVKYNVAGNKMYDQLSKDLGLEFDRCGQTVLFTTKFQKLLLPFIKLRGKLNDIPIEGLTNDEIKEIAPNVGYNYGGFACPSAGIICPYQTTIAFAESAAINGVEIALNCAVTGIVSDGTYIKAVKTTRGTIFPKVVINAAGVFSDTIAEWAGDRFFTIHPRKGVEIIMDKKANQDSRLTKSVIGIMVKKGSKTKGGGILPTIDKNTLLGPNATEIIDKEDEKTSREDIDEIWAKQSTTVPSLKRQDIITYFAGTRAPSYEEEFIIEKNKKVRNFVQAAAIQSPGITAAPAIAVEIANLVIQAMYENENIVVKPNTSFVATRKPIPKVSEMTVEERDELIKKNPDYGEIVCRCEEISKGEIIDVLRSPIVVPQIDAIKRRVRPGMGRCQGGFCSPLVAEIISKECNIPLVDITKKGSTSKLFVGKTK
ncbi:MAG TPA: NAD(P)/FAD-dependent oxidoreductase [Clostridia bacterium]|nr:NAD(P)/FAD-dependent oxidoreductase [Clostridia bacterium]